MKNRNNIRTEVVEGDNWKVELTKYQPISNTGCYMPFMRYDLSTYSQGKQAMSWKDLGEVEAKHLLLGMEAMHQLSGGTTKFPTNI